MMTNKTAQHKMMTVDVEDWFNILDSDVVPDISKWDSLETRFDKSLQRFLELFEQKNIKATFFWLGWFAERHPDLVRQCQSAGHEIASHGYAHLLAFKAGQKAFGEDASRGKKILEDITGEPVYGYRAAGFSTTSDTPWFYEELAQAGFTYDSSVFPASRGHGGIAAAPMEPYRVETTYGDIIEIPQSVISIGGKRVSLFGGGYLRLAPWGMIHWGVKQLKKANRPLIVYVHPREIDPKHPRLKLPLVRRFKCYVNLKTTYRKLEKLCQLSDYISMNTFVEQFYCQKGMCEK